MARTPARPVGANFGSRPRAASIGSGVADELAVALARGRRVGVQAAEAKALIEGQGRQVARAGPDAHAPAVGARQRLTHESRADAATEERRRDEQPRDDQLVGVMLAPDD